MNEYNKNMLDIVNEIFYKINKEYLTNDDINL